MTDIPASLSDESSASKSLGIVNGGVFIAVLALGIVVYMTPLKTWLAEGQLIKEELAQFGIAGPLVFCVGAAALTAIGLPRLLLCSLAGMAFGFAYGVLWSELGTVLGSYATFMFVRWRGRDYALDHFPRLRRFSEKLEAKGLVSVLLIRQLPMNGFYNNVFLGLTPVTHRQFIVGSMLGYLPLGVTASLIGAGLLQADATKSIQYLMLALISSFGLGWGLKHLVSRKRSSGD
jgi:uncharacterized membrane protein YdjX (TVP38/TMEM64 family)